MALFIQKVRDDLEAVSSNPALAEAVRDAIRVLDGANEGNDLMEQMDAVYKGRNLVRLAISGIAIGDERLIEFANDSIKDVAPLPVAPELVDGLAAQLYKSATAMGDDKLIISGAKSNLQILEAIARMCIRDGREFVLDVVNHQMNAVLINNATDDGLERLAGESVDLFNHVGARVEARGSADKSIGFDQDKLKRFSAMQRPISDMLKSGKKHYSVTIIPTEGDADLDGMEFDDYMKLFFEAADQPWAEIEAAQDKLKERLDAGREVRITNADGTDITFSIEGQTFVNSVVLKNIPGSELFSSPLRESANGVIVAKGNFKLGDFPAITDITLRFENGRIVDFSAAEGEETLRMIIESDEGKGEGSRYLGELAFGTNPHLRRQFVNPLLVEKVGRSFHVALGSCYTYDTYAGKPVRLQNGNKSASGIHWDVTTMLGGTGGKVMLDGVTIQNDGIWVDEDGVTSSEELRILNQGWGALPQERQPEWWKQHYPDGYAE